MKSQTKKKKNKFIRYNLINLITILPVTVYAREIIIGDALEACEV